MDVVLVPGRETHDDDCEDKQLVDVGLVPGWETHDETVTTNSLGMLDLSPDA